MMGKLIDVTSARETADVILGDPILKMAVNAVLNNTQGFDLVRCKDCLHRHTRPNCHGRPMNFFCADGERMNNDGK